MSRSLRHHALIYVGVLRIQHRRNQNHSQLCLLHFDSVKDDYFIDVAGEEIARRFEDLPADICCKIAMFSQ